jgi:hypothetical protein
MHIMTEDGWKLLNPRTFSIGAAPVAHNKIDPPYNGSRLLRSVRLERAGDRGQMAAMTPR